MPVTGEQYGYPPVMVTPTLNKMDKSIVECVGFTSHRTFSLTGPESTFTADTRRIRLEVDSGCELAILVGPVVMVPEVAGDGQGDDGQDAKPHP
jgi:hypothetical protein